MNTTLAARVLPFPAPKSEQLELFPLIDPGKWQGTLPPRREWMVDSIFARGSVGLVAGEGKIGKSLLMQQLCTCAVLGHPWFGLPVRQGRAVYFACEDDEDELHRRQADINRHYGCEHADLGDAGLVIAPRLNHDNILSEIDRSNWRMTATPLFARVLQRCIELGISWVVIDTQAQTFGGQIVNFQHAIQYMAQLRRMAMKINGLVILVTHPSDNGRRLKTGEAGSTQWVNASRSHVYVHHDKTHGLVIEHMRGNYSARGKQIPIEYRDGVFVERTPATTHWIKD